MRGGVQDQREKKRQGSADPPEETQTGQTDESRLIAIYRSLSPENRRNVMRYVEAVSDIESIFTSTDRNR